jgi:hypothetical protein
LAIVAQGVGHFWTARKISVRFIPELRSPEHGLGVGRGARKFLGERPADRSATPFVLLASGVGNNPYPVSSVRGANGARRYAMPFRVMPDLGQVSEYRVQPSTKQRCHVLQHRVSRSNHAKGSNNFPVESGTGAGKSGAFAGKADVLTRKACADNIRLAPLEIVSRYVVVARHMRPVFRQHGAGVGLHFAKADRLAEARAFQP